MKNKYIFLCIATAFFCLIFASCTRTATMQKPIVTKDTYRTGAVSEIIETTKSQIEVTTNTTPAQTIPTEVLITAQATTATTKKPTTIEAPKEFYTVKFVDSNGYTSLSVQTVLGGGDAVPPEVPTVKGDLFFRGWDKEYTNIQKSTVIKAIYQKEFLNVNFYDIDGTLLKSETVRYGEDATAPEVDKRADYEFDGWSVLFFDVTEDINTYATYYITPQRRGITIFDAYSFLPVKQNAISLPVSIYYRKEYLNSIEIGSDEYNKNIIYGSFYDEFDISDYDFETFESILVFTGVADDTESKYSIRLSIYCDGEKTFSAELSQKNSKKNIKIPLEGVSKIAIHLEPLLDDFIYYENPQFIGGLVNSIFYEK